MSQAIREHLPRLAALAPSLAAKLCDAAGVDPTGPLAGVAWLAGPVALLAKLRRLVDRDELGARGAITAKDLRARLSGAVVMDHRPRWLWERRRYQDAAVRFLFQYRSTIEILAEASGAAAPALLEVHDEAARQALAPLVESGALHVEIAPRSRRWGAVLVTPNLYAKDEIAFMARRLAAEIAAARAFGLPGPSRIYVAAFWAQQDLFTKALWTALGGAPAPALRVVSDAEPGPDDVAIFRVGPEWAEGFLEMAVPLANAAGATTVEIIAHVVTLEDRRGAEAVDRALWNLEARHLGVNEWPLMADFRGASASPLASLATKTIIHGLHYDRRAPLYFLDAAAAVERAGRLVAFHADPPFFSWALHDLL